MTANRSIWSKYIIVMNISKKSSALVLKLLLWRGSFEVKVRSEYFIRTITIKYHFTITFLPNFSANHPVANRSPYWSYVIWLYGMDDLRNCSKEVIRRNTYFSMIWSNMLSNHLSIFKIWGAWETNWECFQRRLA